jgi:hypothetical protein
MKRTFERAVAVGCGLVLVVMIVIGAGVAYESSVLRDFRSWEVNGPAPIAQTMYYAQGSRVTELFVTTVPGTKLSDVADMTVFQGALPGLSGDEFRTKHGEASIRTGQVCSAPHLA